MGIFRDLVGQKFGRLLIDSRDESNTGRRIKWNCVCDCGNRKSIVGESLSKGVIRSCGCLRKELVARMRFVDLTGKRFGRLLVIGLLAERRNNRTDWDCLCDCGASAKRTQYDLTNSITPSCGCFQLERVAEMGTAKRLPLKIGSKYGRLTVRKNAGAENGSSISICECDCGTVKAVQNHQLLTGRVISCGCAWIDRPGLRPSKVNAYQAARSIKRRAVEAGAGGSFTDLQINRLYSAQRGRCACCGVVLKKKFHRDHKTALVNGGSNDISNIELLCALCNLKKGRKDPIAWANENGRLC